MQLTPSNIEKIPNFTDVALELFLEIDVDKPDYKAFLDKISSLRGLSVNGYHPDTYTYNPQYLELARKEFKELKDRGELPISIEGYDANTCVLEFKKALSFALRASDKVSYHDPFLVEDSTRYVCSQSEFLITYAPKSFYKAVFLAAMYQKHFPEIRKLKSHYVSATMLLEHDIRPHVFHEISSFFANKGSGFAEEFNFDTAFKFLLKTSVLFDFMTLDKYQQNCYGLLWDNLYLKIIKNKERLEELVKGIFKYSSAQSIPYCLRSSAGKYYLTEKLSGAEFLQWFNKEGLLVNVRTLSAFQVCFHYFDSSVTDLYDTFIMYKFKDNKKSIGYKLMKRIEHDMEYI